MAQAKENEIDEYIKLLWKDGKAPNSVKKYYRRKRLLISTNQRLLKLNRECEAMLKNGVKPKTIAMHYLTEKEKIETHSQNIKKRLKSIERIKKQEN